ncbi:MAG TPA: hypothetical protein DCY13_02260, partial [Verrucomicrobiales bacterium]|nr:hypothetical protein [Verrucomicrobiales bacterium]
MIERCEWEHFDELRQLATSGKLIDLSAGEPDRQRSGWIELGRELRRQYLPEAEPVKEAEGAAADHRRQWVPQSRIAESPLAEEARQILQAAAKLAQQRGRELLPLSTSCVLFALAESPDRTGGFIASHFRRRGDARVEEIAEKFFLYHVNLAAQERPRQTDLERIRVGQSMTPNVELLLQASADLARATTGSLEIGVRHLAAALLCAGDRDFGARKRIEELGVRQQELRQDLLEFVLKHHPDDDQENWHAMMAGRSPRMRKESPAPPSGSGEAERKKTAEAAAPKNLEPVDALPGVVLPGFDADFWRQAGREGADPNPDLLDIRDEVNALASLAAAWTVEPPLSIGLFG